MVPKKNLPYKSLHKIINKITEIFLVQFNKLHAVNQVSLLIFKLNIPIPSKDLFTFLYDYFFDKC